jgi:hypothetical protein
VGVTIDKLECNAPVSADIYRPQSFSLAFQGVKSKTGQIHIVDIHGRVQSSQSKPDLLAMSGVNASNTASLKELSQSFVLERQNHQVELYAMLRAAQHQHSDSNGDFCPGREQPASPQDRAWWRGRRWRARAG